MEKNVEMKDSTDKKPEAEKKEEVKVPNDKFYGKSLQQVSYLA